MNDNSEAMLTRLLSSLDTPENVRELAHAVAHRAFVAELHEQRPFKEVVVCAVYIAFQHGSNDHRFRGVTATTTFDPDSISRTYRLLADELGRGDELESDPAPPDLHEFVARFAGPVDVSDETEARAHDIVDESVEAGLLSGVVPAGVAAGALYLADSEHSDRLIQQEVADVAGVSSLTLRHRYAEQATLLGDGEHGSIAPGRRKYLAAE